MLPAISHALPTADLSIVGSLALGMNTIDFLPAGGGTGSFSVVAPSTGSFAALLGTSGQIKDLDVASQPVNSPISLANFLTFAADPTLTFTLSFIDPGIFSSAACGAAPAIGQTCTPSTGYGPALNFTNVQSGSTLSLAVAGKALDGSDVFDFTGVFTAQFAGVPFQTVLGTLAVGGTVSASYSAAFQAVVPEPTTGACVALGVAVLALAGRRRSLGASGR